jgi:hypothetical protein
MVRLRPVIAGLFVMLGGVSCTVTEMRMAHDNPLDRIFDSGSFRLVLTSEATATNAALTWGSVYYTDAKGKITELSTSEIQISGTAQLLYNPAAPSQTDLNTVKQGADLPVAYTPAFPLTSAGAGTFTTTAAAFKGYYIIRLNYKYDDKTGRLYSNFVAVQ